MFGILNMFYDCSLVVFIFLLGEKMKKVLGV